METLAQLPSLLKLSVGGSAITDIGLKHMASFSKLGDFSVHDCAGVTDEGLREIAKGPAITYVSIGGKTKVTDAGLLALASMKKLKSVNVRWCKGVTEAGAAALRKAAPGVDVWYDP